MWLYIKNIPNRNLVRMKVEINFLFKSVCQFLVVFSMLCYVGTVAAKQAPVTIIYSGNLDGELEPCGCSEQGNLGGIKRRTTVIDNLRKQNPGVIVVSSGGLISSEGVNDYLKSEFIFKAFAQLGYDAIGLQWKDLGFGAELAETNRLPWVSSNWIDSRFAKSSYIKRNIAGQKIVVQFFSWLDPDSSPARQMPGAKHLTYEKYDRLNGQLARAKQNKEITMLATTLPFESLQGSIDLANVDIVIVKSGYEVYDEPKLVQNTLVLKPGSRGMRLGKLDLLVDDSDIIKKWSHETISMPPSVVDAPRMINWYKEYNAKVKQDYLKRVAIRKQRESGDSPYAGEEQCNTCHAAQHQVWQASEHAKAFEDLESVQKSFDPECLACHTVGFNQAGGYVDFNITPQLTNVQCENCHGAAKDHVSSAGKTPVANHGWPREKMCSQCHVQKHSPGFNIQVYWPKIAH